MLKADAQRQISMLRQELLTELLSILTEAHEPGIRARIARLVETQLRSGLLALEKAESLWPSQAEAKEVIEEPELKPALQKRWLKVFEQLDKVQSRSCGLLRDSFANVRLILERVQAGPVLSESTHASKAR
jgi:hypothetical protein